MLEFNVELITENLTSFLKEELRKTGLTNFTLGLSGGVDSAVVAFLAARAIGPENVHALYLPYKSSSQESEGHSRLSMEGCGVNYQVISITKMIDSYFDDVDPEASPLRRGNKMSRERMAILYDHSAKYGGVVLGTSNKTELLLGYGTQHGDMASALNPIGDIYKTKIFELARYLQVPEPLIVKKPSADLWAGQSDEEDLGFTYAEVDALLENLIEKRKTIADLLANGFKQEFITKVIGLINRSQFKRRMPLIAKVSLRPIDSDFSYPKEWEI